jgi:hypothetical protein
MIAIGYWIESIVDSPFPAPQECVGEWPVEVRQQIADYLDSGRLCEQYRGLSWCRFRCGVAEMTMGSREFTDGVWIWPEGLSHYVREHSVILPTEFTDWVLRKSAPPAVPRELHDFTLWIDWGKGRGNIEFRRRLRQVYHQHRRRVLEEFRALKKKCTQAVSPETKCLWFECGCEAPPGKAFCPYHQLSPQHKRTQLGGHYMGHNLLAANLKSAVPLSQSSESY